MFSGFYDWLHFTNDGAQKVAEIVYHDLSLMLPDEMKKKIKEKYPQCLIIFGGPQVPDNMNGFFEKYPYSG